MSKKVCLCPNDRSPKNTAHSTQQPRASSLAGEEEPGSPLPGCLPGEPAGGPLPGACPGCTHLTT